MQDIYLRGSIYVDIISRCSCFFAGLTYILVKCSIRKTDSTVATAIHTVIVLIMA